MCSSTNSDATLKKITFSKLINSCSTDETKGYLKTQGQWFFMDKVLLELTSFAIIQYCIFKWIYFGVYIWDCLIYVKILHNRFISQNFNVLFRYPCFVIECQEILVTRILVTGKKTGFPFNWNHFLLQGLQVKDLTNICRLLRLG